MRDQAASRIASLPLRVPGEIQERQTSSLPHLLYVSTSNRGAIEAAQVLQRELPCISLTETPPALLELGGACTVVSNGDAIEDADTPTGWLLYLRRDTFDGDAGRTLSAGLHAALEAGFPVLMLHEKDEDAGGCQRFDPIFEATPQELHFAGLYRQLAIEWHPPPFRTVSVAHVARLLGSLGGSTPDVDCSGVVGAHAGRQLGCCLCIRNAQSRLLHVHHEQGPPLVEMDATANSLA